ELLGDEVRGLLLSSVQVADSEVESEWRMRNNKIELEFVEYNPAEAKASLSVTPEEVAAWKEQNRKKIEEHWNTKKFLYFGRKQYQVRQIALRLPAAAAPAARDTL